MSFDARVRRQLVPTGKIDRLLRRINCQIAFASELPNDQNCAAEARKILEQAEYSSVDALEAAVLEAERALAPLAEEAKSFTIHLIGHGHIDMNWMWSWPETCATTHDTFASVLSLMREYPELTYTQSQASVYAIIEKYHPAMFEEIRARVREGRWEVAAVHWVEGDKNLASGEALARHLLYTRKYLREKFGLAAEDVAVDWEPDTFGHCNTLPGILQQAGVKYYYCCRSGGGQEHPRVGDPRPPMFWWESPDGSRILVCKETTWYNSYVEIGDNFALPALRFWKETGLKDWMNVYGIGNHGGGPTRKEIDYFLETREWPCWPKITFGTAQRWFEKVEPLCAEAPVLQHELNFEFTGCYTSQSAIKRANRLGENYCLEAEALAALNHDSAAIAPMRDAWINVLFNQFHDILPGSGVAATRQHALGLFQETGALAGAVKRNQLSALAADIDTCSLLPKNRDGDEERALVAEAGPRNHPNTPFEAGAGQGAGESGFSRAAGGGKRFRPIMIFNPCAWVRSELVSVSLYDLENDVKDDQIVALDEEGRAHPTLNVTGAIGGTHDWGHRRTDLLFHASDIPALGYRVFLFCEGEATVEMPQVSQVDEVTLQGKDFRFRLDKFSGGLESAHFSGQDAGAWIGRFHAVEEWPTGMSAWLLGGNRGDAGAIYRKPPRTLESRKFRTIGCKANEGTSLRSGSNFAVVASQELIVPDTRSSVNLTTFVSGEGRRIDWSAKIDWREIGSDALGIPGLTWITSTDADEATFDTPFGTVDRALSPGDLPTLNTVTFKSGAGWITLITDCKYGVVSEEGRLGFRVLRSTYFPDPTPEVAESFMRASAVFHFERPSQADCAKLAASWNQPLTVLPILLQHGKSPVHHGYLECLTPDVVVTGLKMSEEGNCTVVRLANYSDSEITAELQFDEALKHLEGPQLLDLLERPVRPLESVSGKIRVPISANSFASVAL